ncbi:glycosyltransferase [Pontibacter burrus]|uniref:Glycosyl transferase family 28 n=1 Tax=Pontibacter burrus TaxID=2704466 RepID=A0A6B3LLE5_9BACT|nr:glycosyltransferase [Pontibacter burrus]NEM97752.1 glycosyl transferase family 28 [Pontibacter burrus]
MIFLTTGTQEPFDRLVKAMDDLCPMLKGKNIVAQVANSAYKVRHMETYNFLEPEDFNRLFQDAELIVGHAGMGTIISALMNEKPLLIMPRLSRYGEHRNDHQLATAKAFDRLKYVRVAYEVKDLNLQLEHMIKGNLRSMHQLKNYASDELINSVRHYIHSLI